LENADLYSPDGGQIPIFLKKGGAHRCVLGAKIKPGNGDFDRSPPALHPPFYGAVGGVSFACCLLFVLMDLPLAKCIRSLSMRLRRGG
jgi:hypothetical protein